ncbi:hypothetical protein HYALB_00012005 [Hymenoscyphus albidus]|uniref:GED domain-containing protein n=1 Tax=Hymenoscyphus albidus TaxID=595503 RepID=A0A9N9LLB7_9HELO|nr:hypothetical protein HYALB_00012005 [Hymenoscyphus albidus]
MIWESLLDIEEDVQLQTREINERLAALPEVSQDQVQFTVRNILHKFAAEAENMLAGKILVGKFALQGQDRFHNQWRILCKQFQSALEQMQPELICTYPSADGFPDRPRLRNEEQINLVSDEDEDEEVRQPANKRQAPDDQFPRTPAKPPFLNRAQTPVTPVKQEIIASPSLMHRLTLPNQNAAKFGPFSRDDLEYGRNSWTIAEVKQTIDENAIPGRVLTAMEPWKHPLETFHETTFTMLRKHMNNVLSDVLRNYQGTELYRASKKHINEFISYHEKIQQERLMTLYNAEHVALFTTDLPGFKIHKQQALDKLNAACREARVQVWLQAPANQGPKDKEHMKDEDLAKYLPYSRELEVAAYVIGYYHLARVRFAEAVCGSTKVSLFMEMEKEIKYLLEGKLELNVGDCEEKCQMLLFGNARIAQKRHELLKMQEKLKAASNVLERIRGLIDSNIDDSDITMQPDNGGIDVDPVEGNHAWDRCGVDAPIDFTRYRR